MAGVITTIRDRCKRCYSCVRNCPAKAIRVTGGQAEVIEERCIGCGSCYKVCAQQAKAIRGVIPQIRAILAGPEPVFACLAPSFPAAFPDLHPGQVVTGLRRLGFAEVLEVAFGAELVARQYARLAHLHPGRVIITTPCPAVVTYVEKYVPALVPHLAPIVSPMIALGRAIKQKYRPGARVVFVGPCTAKKNEVDDPEVAGAVDHVVSFRGFETMLEEAGIDLKALPPSDFDGPRPGTARVFPVSGGLLKTAMMRGDVLNNEVLVTEGRDNVIPLLEELARDGLEVKFADVLFCEGCIDGPVLGAGQALTIFRRKELVTDYVKERSGRQDQAGLQALLEEYSEVDLSRKFTAQPVEEPIPTEEEIRAILRSVNKFSKEDELNCHACGYRSCREKAIAVYQGLAESQMCLPYLIEQLQENLRKLEKFSQDLAAAQEELVHAERLASMGQLAAGVAHEINNPLGTILLYSSLMLRGLPAEDPRGEDLRMVVSETTRCRDIVAGLLNFARQGRLDARETDLNALVDETLAQLERQPAMEKVQVAREYDSSLPKVTIDAAQMRQVFLNIIVNAAEAMPDGGTLTVRTGPAAGGGVFVSFSDTGIGITEDNMARLFTPFFTTKQLGKGTGLGLPIAYGIVKMHRGQIQVQSQPGAGATFTITLPLQVAPAGPFVG